MRALRAAALLGCLAFPSFAAEPQQQPPATEKQAEARPVLDVVFVLDTTSSMGGLIEGAKAKIWSIASRMATGKPTPRIRVGLVGFRDKGDAYVTKRFDLSEDLDAVYKNLQGFKAEGGGDTPEHVGRGLGEAVKFMSWNQEPKTAKLIFLVGDAPAQEYHDGWSAKDWAKVAISKGIVVNTIRCGSDLETEHEFRALAKLADGSYLSIQQSGGMVAVATPYDKDLAEVNEKLATTTLVGGEAPARDEWRAKKESLRTLAPSVAADRISFTNNAGLAAGYAGVGKGSVDLSQSPEKLAELKEADLPTEVRSLDPAKRRAFVEENAKENKALQGRAAELAKKRDQWLKDNKPKTVSFDDEVMNTVAGQAKRAGVTY